MPKKKTTSRSGKGGGSLKARLKKVGSMWKDACEEADDVSLQTLDDGNYIARLTKMDVGQSKSSNRLQITSEWTVVQGDEAGNIAYRYDGLERPEGLPYVVNYLTMLGAENIEDVDMEDLQTEVCDKLVEARPAARIAIVTKGEFTNLHLRKLVDVDEDVESSKGEESRPPEVGDEVTVELGGDDYNGRVVYVDEDDETANVKLEEKYKGKSKKTVSWEDLTYKDGEKPSGDGDDDADGDGDREPEEDDEVTLELGGEEYEGTVVSVDEGDKEATIKLEEKYKGKKRVTVEWSDLTYKGGNESGETKTPEKGDQVLVEHDDKEKEGKIVKVDKKKEVAVVKLKKPKGKEIKVDFDDLKILIPDD